jgi:hypothetical protein
MTTSTDIARKVRALLDRAERTPFPAEAEAATRKALELMATHHISEAMVGTARAGHDEAPALRSIHLERSPYIAVRMSLLVGIAGALGVHTVYSVRSSGRRVDLIGFPADLDAVELLYSSLLLQATAAVTAERAPTSLSTIEWRRGFLAGFAERVAQRLRDAVAAASSTADGTTAGGTASVAIVLADREARIEDEVRRRYPHLGRGRPPSKVSAAALARGTAAGSRADLGRQSAVHGHRGQLPSAG